MFVLCVLHNKDKRQKSGQTGQRSTAKVDIINNKKKSRRGHGYLCCVLYVEAKCRAIKTRKQVRIKERVQENTKKKKKVPNQSVSELWQSKW
jgi:hypothetical protein